MNKSISWNSQPLYEFAKEHAQGKFININGLTTHYIEKGSGNPIILIHGFFFDSYMWHQNIDILASNHTVYAIDLWGFGYSTRTHLNYGYSLYSNQLLKFMDALKIEKASLIGHSMGGGIIIKYLSQYKERVAKAILVNSAGMPNPLPNLAKISQFPFIGELMYSLKGSYIRKLALTKNFLHNRDKITKEFYNEATRFQQIKGTTQALLYITRKQFFDTLFDDIKSVGKMNMPILIIWGKQDKSISVTIGEKLHQILVGSQFNVIDQAGHCSNIDQPEQFNKLTINFLA